ncbi:hypothetical protein EC973_001811 [Apophysomyces ossiformis]|uniref:Uncharacterized protein n=1 Tax=Apophysomyces ossiformis TaxID=679940 RepID=A0A8H7BHF9_9FUNG|nr:hypothetical protein EC973_001811 [Apophysomyces ossiformis]
MLKDVDNRVDKEEFSAILHEDSMKTIGRIKDDVEYYRKSSNENRFMSEGDKGWVKSTLEKFDLEIKQCDDKLRIKSLEDENKKTNAERDSLKTQLQEKQQYCDEVSKKLRVLEIVREELEERRIPLSSSLIVRAVLSDGDEKVHHLTFDEGYISYKALCKTIQKCYSLEADCFSLSYTASNGEMKQIASPKMFEDAFESAKPRLLFDVHVLALEVRVEPRSKDNTEGSESGAAVIGDAIQRLQKTLIDVDKRVDQVESLMMLLGDSMKTIQRLKEEIEYYKNYIKKNAHITDQERTSLRNRLDIFELKVEHCHDKLCIKRLEHENRQKDEVRDSLAVELSRQQQCCEELQKKVRELEISREKLEEQSVCLAYPLIVRVVRKDNGKIHHLSFDDGYVSYRGLSQKIQEQLSLEPNCFALTYSTPGKTAPLNSPETLKTAIQTIIPHNFLPTETVFPLEIWVQVLTESTEKLGQNDKKEENGKGKECENVDTKDEKKL